MSVQDPRKDAWKIWFQRHWVLLMCSPLAVLPHQHVAAQRLMEIQTDGQRNLLEWNAAGILQLSCHRSRNCFSLGLTANDKSCTIVTMCLIELLTVLTLLPACYVMWIESVISSGFLHFFLLCLGKENQTVTVIHFSFPPSSPGSPSLSGTGTVTVLVNDVNDNVPIFTSSTFHTTIMEDAPTGSDVLLVNSSDADVGVNGVIRYL